MVTLRRVWVAALLALAAVTIAHAQNAPTYNGPVTDGANILSPDITKRLSDQLARFAEEQGVPVSILTVNSIQPSSMEEFIGQTLVAWGDSGPARDGVILIVALRDGRLQLHVGPLARDKLSQPEAARVINQVVMPLMSQGNFAGGLEAGATEIMRLLETDARAEPVDAGSPLEDEEEPVQFDLSYLLVSGVAAVFAGLLLRSAAGLLGGAAAGAAIMGLAATHIASAPIGVALSSAAVVFFVFTSLEALSVRPCYTERVFSRTGDHRQMEEGLGGASGFW